MLWMNGQMWFKQKKNRDQGSGVEEKQRDSQSGTSQTSSQWLDSILWEGRVSISVWLGCGLYCSVYNE